MADAIFPQQIKNDAVAITNADGTTAKQLMVAGSNGRRVDSIAATNSDTSNAVKLQLSVTIGANTYNIGIVNIPAGSGTDGTHAAVDVLNDTDLPWLRNDGVSTYLFLAASAILKVAPVTTVASGKTVHLFAQSGDY